MPRYLVLSAPVVGPAYRYAVSLEQAAEISGLSAEEIQWAIEETGWASTDIHTIEEVPPMTLGGHDVNIGLSEYHTRRAAHFVTMGDQAKAERERKLATVYHQRAMASVQELDI